MIIPRLLYGATEWVVSFAFFDICKVIATIEVNLSYSYH